MKKFLLTTVILGCLCMALTACGSRTNPVTGYKTGDVTLGEYTGIAYTPLSTEVSEEEIDTRLDSLLEANSELVDLDKESVEDGDLVIIDYEGTKDGVAFSGGTATDAELVIGSGRFIDGFESGLIGVRVGEQVQLPLTFPENYTNEELAGAAVNFTVTVKRICEKEIPELSDETIANITDFATVAEYRDSQRASIKASKETSAETSKLNAVMDAIVSNATINKDISAEIAKTKSEMITTYNANCQSAYGVDAATFFSILYGMNETAFDVYMEREAESSIKYGYVLSAIADKEKLEATEEEKEALVAAMLENYGFESKDALYTQIGEFYGAKGDAVIEGQVLLNKAQELVIASAVAQAAEVTE